MDTYRTDVWRRATLLAWLALFLLAALSGRSAGQSVQNYFEHATVTDGLSNATVNAIHQDRRGFIWFGTKGGLDRYDGHQIRNFRNDENSPNSLPDNWVTSIVEDDSGAFWIGTRYSGLVRMHPDSMLFRGYPFGLENSPDGLESAYVTCLLFDREGRLWIGTNETGLSRYDPDTGRFRHFRADSDDASRLASDNISVIFQDAGGTMWVGTWAHGAHRYVEDSDTFTRFNYAPIGTQNSSDRIRAITQDRHGEYWVGTTGGLIRRDRAFSITKRYRPDAQNPSSLADRNAWAVHEDSQGSIWIGTVEAGLERFDRPRDQFAHYPHDPNDERSLINETVNTIYEDRAGVLWIATDGGVSKYDLTRTAYVHFRLDPGGGASPGNNDVRAMLPSAVHPGLVWLGTAGGLYRFDTERETFERFNRRFDDPTSIASDLVYALDEDRDGRLWIGMPNAGLDVLDPATGSVRHFRHDPTDPLTLSSDAVRSVVATSDGSVWAGTDGGGLNRLDSATGMVERHVHRPGDPASLSDDNVSILFEDSRGIIWAGTYDAGLNRLDPATGNVVRISPAQALPGPRPLNRITSFLEIEEGEIWAGTHAGLLRYNDRDGTLARYSSAEGLQGGAVIGLAAAPDGMLWLEMEQGLSRFDPGESRFDNFGSAQGLPELEYNPGTLVMTHSGELVVGGANGFSQFSLAGLESSAALPRPIITEVTVAGDKLATDLFPGSEISLSHRDVSFSLDFALLTYESPGAHRFRYRMDGLDEDWRTASGAERRAEYRNPDRKSGEMTLTVQGSRDGSTWSESTFVVLISPPWWMTPWFLSTGSILFVIVAAAGLWYRIESRRRELAERRRMLAEGRERERLLVTRTLHDSPLQTLYVLQHKLINLKESEHLAPSRDPSDVDEASDLVQQAADELRNIVRELRPPSIGPFGLAAAIRDHAGILERENEHLDFILDLPEEVVDAPNEVQLILFRIFQGAASNTVRHAKASEVHVSLDTDEAAVHLRIRDDGTGFIVPKNWLELAREGHFGMLGLSEWADAAGASLDVRSSPGEGTLVHVAVPRTERPSSRIFTYLAAFAGVFSRRSVPDHDSYAPDDDIGPAGPALQGPGRDLEQTDGPKGESVRIDSRTARPQT